MSAGQWSSLERLRASISAGELSRRDVLRRAMGLGLSAPAITALLAACGGDDDDASNSGSDSEDAQGAAGQQEQETSAEGGATETEAGGTDAASTESEGSGESGGNAEASGQVIVGLSQEPTVFHPLMPGIEVDAGVYYNLFSTLWGVDETGTYFPILATEVPTVENGGISEDGKTWTVMLRDDVTWHDGEAFSADDVKFTLDLIMQENFNADSRQGHELVTDFQVVSPTEVSWTMETAYAPYIAILARTFIVPKHILEGAEDPNKTDFNNNPVGTGYYMWEERIPGDHLTLTANPNYFGEGPNIKTLVFKYIPDLNVMYTQFKTGEIDFTGIQGITANHYAEAKEVPDRVVDVSPSTSIENIWFNHEYEQFQDKAVRQALYYGMDKESIIADVYYGLPTGSESYLPEQSWAYNPDLPAHEYNPEKAIELLEGAGWVDSDGDGIREKDGVKLSFTNSTTAGNQVREQAQVYLQQTWQEIGVQLEIKNMPAAVVWGEYYNQSQFQSLMVGIFYGIGADPDVLRRFHTDADANYVQYSNPELDKLLEKGVTTVDREERKKIYADIQAYLREELVFLPIFQYADIQGRKAGLAGFVANPFTESDCWNVNTWRWE